MSICSDTELNCIEKIEELIKPLYV